MIKYELEFSAEFEKSKEKLCKSGDLQTLKKLAALLV
jgi:hypothetical protein